ncbi:MAG: DUF4172 domain-containing protein [Tannerellaceae bacterium]|jgi:hypothetical protein|nr:DUF4172 domain-containing protein [Tannerellaceae bacterium]
MAKYIYQYDNWTDFSWQNASVSAVLGETRLLQGKKHNYAIILHKQAVPLSII